MSLDKEEVRKALESLDAHKRRFAGEGVTTQMDFIINAPTWLHALLAENEQLERVTAEKTQGWGECEAQNQQLREELEQVKKERDEWIHDATESRKRLSRLRSELAEKDKAMELLIDQSPDSRNIRNEYGDCMDDAGDWNKVVENAATILAQYKAVSHET